MRFLFNRIPQNDEFVVSNKWQVLKENENLWIVQIQSLPIIAIIFSIVYFGLQLFNFSFRVDLFKMILAFIILFPIHEFIHALFFPGGPLSNKVIYGFLTNGLSFFAYFQGEIKRNSFIIMLVSPLVIITIIGISILLIFGDNDLIKHIIVFNALSAGPDCLGALKILNQVPRNSILQNKNKSTYYRPLCK